MSNYCSWISSSPFVPSHTCFYGLYLKKKDKNLLINLGSSPHSLKELCLKQQLFLTP